MEDGNSKKPKVSVVMSAYNCKKYVEEAVQSVLAQDFDDFEFIIMDNMSDDGTYEILKKYEGRDERVRLFRNNENLGISKSRNAGIEKVRGEVIANMDSDDVCEKGRLGKQYEFMLNHPEVGVVGSDVKIIDENGKETGKRKYPSDDADLKKLIFRTGPFAQSATMVRKEVYEKVGMYNDKYEPADDLDLWIRAGREFKFASISKFLLKYRISSDSVTSKKMARMRKGAVKAKIDAMLKHGYKAGIGDVAYIIGQGSLVLVPQQVLNILRARQ